MTEAHAFTDLTVHLPEWLTTAEVAAIVRAPEPTVRYWRHLGRGPKGTRVGRRVLYKRSDVEMWLADLEAAEHGPGAA